MVGRLAACAVLFPRGMGGNTPYAILSRGDLAVILPAGKRFSDLRSALLPVLLLASPSRQAADGGDQFFRFHRLGQMPLITRE